MTRDPLRDIGDVWAHVAGAVGIDHRLPPPSRPPEPPAQQAQAPTTEPELITVTEAAEILTVDPHSVVVMIGRGLFRDWAPGRVGRRGVPRIERARVEARAQERARPGPSAQERRYRNAERQRAYRARKAALLADLTASGD